MGFLQKGIKLNKNQYEAVRQIANAFQEVIEKDMSPTDDTPYEATGEEILMRGANYLGAYMLGKRQS